MDVSTIVVTFPGHHLIPLAWILTRFPRKKLIFDVFISVSDTLVSDRRKFSWWNPVAWFLYLVDFVSCHLADEILIDTKAHGQFFTRRFLLKPSRVRVVYLEARKDLFFPSSNPPAHRSLDEGGSPNCEVFFYGSYIPLQGIEYILGAAKILESNNSIHFTLVGSGQTYPEMRKKAEELNLSNVTFKKFVPLEDLPDLIRNSDVCLGIFGIGGKTQRVIPHKVYDAVACGIPVITADTPAIHEKFTDGKEVILCRAGDSEDLAEKIRTASTVC